MWKIERHEPRQVNVEIIGEGPGAIKEVLLDGYYMIVNDVDGRYVHNSTGGAPKKFDDFQEAVDLCAWFIEQDYPEAVKYAPK